MNGSSVIHRSAGVVLALFVGMGAAPLMGHEDVGGQIQALTEQLQQEPGNAALFLRRAELHRHLEHWDLAERDLNRAERLDGRLGGVHLSRALLFLESDRLGRALSSVDRFLKLEPKRADAHQTRGRILFRLGRLAESEKALTTAIQLLESPAADAYLERNDVILAQGPARRSRALDGLDEGIARLGPVVTLELAAIELERNMRNWDGALQRIDRLARVSPRKEGWLVRRADILRDAGRDSEARRTYAQALEAIESLPQRYRKMALLASRPKLSQECGTIDSLQNSHSNSHATRVSFTHRFAISSGQVPAGREPAQGARGYGLEAAVILRCHVEPRTSIW